jgi:undecaprenyl-diphosphatase
MDGSALVDGAIRAILFYEERVGAHRGGDGMTLPGAMMNYISRRDHRLMRRVNRWPAPRWIRLWALCATRGGDGWLWYGMGAVILLFGGPMRFRAVGAAALAAALGIVIFLVLKKATGRKRPCTFEPHCWATLLPPDRFSFPSGHTITAFAVALSLSRWNPDLAVGLLFCAVSIAASRILLGMHFLSDVLAGAAIGTVLAYTATWIML